MKNVLIYDPSDAVSSFRGSGRIIQILKENLPDAQFISDLSDSADLSDLADSTLLVPSWSPFAPPILTKRIAKKQILMIFDVIPLKYPDHFPAGVKGNINMWRNKRNLAFFDKIITISEHSKRDIVRRLNVPAEKIAVVYPAVSKTFWDLKNEKGEMKINSQISNFKFQIPERFALYVGDVNWNKNLVNLAKAIQIANVPCVFVGKPFENLKNEKGEMKINSQISNFKFQIETHPWLQEFHSFLKIAKNSKNFISLGYVEDQHLIELYKRAVCNVLVSRDEGFGYSYAEAATQKCPSVLSDVDIFHETAGDAALFANPTDPSAIAEKMTQLFQDTKARNDLGEEAYQNTHSRFSPDIFRQSIIDLV